MFCDRSGGHVRVAFDWALRLAKPRLYYEEGSLMADLLALCPVLYKDYAPPLVSMNGGMHMVLSVGEPLRAEKLTSLHEAHIMLSGFPHNLCFTGHVSIDGAALCAPAATHVLFCSSQKGCMGGCITILP